jgi:hypothetical protein
VLRTLLLIAGVMVATTSIAGGASRCPADTVPINIVDEIWGGGAANPALSAAEVSNPHFRAFVTAVTEHVAARLARELPVGHGRSQRCINNAESKKRSLLKFMARRIMTSDDETFAPVPSLGARPSGGCRLSSPWIEIAFERKPVPSVRGVVLWNERQALVDQAMLAGVRNVPTGVAMPLQQSEFERFALDYAKSEIHRKPAAKPIEERIPPDLLWLFRHSLQWERGPFDFAASRALDRAMERGAERYTKLVIALIDHCLASDGADIHYNSILDVADLISLEQYKIVTLTH